MGYTLLEIIKQNDSKIISKFMAERNVGSIWIGYSSVRWLSSKETVQNRNPELSVSYHPGLDEYQIENMNTKRLGFCFKSKLQCSSLIAS